MPGCKLAAGTCTRRRLFLEPTSLRLQFSKLGAGHRPLIITYTRCAIRDLWFTQFRYKALHSWNVNNACREARAWHITCTENISVGRFASLLEGPRARSPQNARILGKPYSSSIARLASVRSYCLHDNFYVSQCLARARQWSYTCTFMLSAKIIDG